MEKPYEQPGPIMDDLDSDEEKGSGPEENEAEEKPEAPHTVLIR